MILVALLAGGGAFAGWYFGVYKGGEASGTASNAQTTPASSDDDSPLQSGDEGEGSKARADAAMSNTVGTPRDASAATDSGGATPDAVGVNAKASDAHPDLASDAATDGPSIEALPATAADAVAQSDRGAETQGVAAVQPSGDAVAGARDAEVVGDGDPNDGASPRDTPSKDAGTGRIPTASTTDAASARQGDASRASDTAQRDATSRTETGPRDDAAGREPDASKGVAKDAMERREATGAQPTADVGGGETEHGPQDASKDTPSDASDKTAPDTVTEATVRVFIVSIPSGATVNDGDEALGKTPFTLSIPRSKLPKTFVLWKRKKGMGVLKLQADVADGASFTVRLDGSR